MTEQRAAIERHASRFGLTITKEYEERETAAKLGRPVFLSILKELKHGKADGIIIHKIDRSARNLRDWAELGELIDRGVEVHFANENLDLYSRGGRLSADIQAVVASDYIRNLREEVKKGFYGRIKQGLFPMPAPVGYLNKGQGQVKEPDPVQAQLVKLAFELYSTGQWGIDALTEKMYKMGLRNRNGGAFSRNGLGGILHNPFYIGLIKIKQNGEMFVGKHTPIIPKQLFDRVQEVLAGKTTKKKHQHFFLFRKYALCVLCGNKLIPELQKGNVYYRCQTRTCTQKTIREERIEESLAEVLSKLHFNEIEYKYLLSEAVKQDREIIDTNESQRKQLLLQLDQLKTRRSKLTDAYIDGVLDEETFLDKKNQSVIEEKDIQDRLERISQNQGQIMERLNEFLELANSAYLSYKKALPEEKRELVETITSNCTVEGKSVLFKLNYPFQVIAEREVVTDGGPYRATTRTFAGLIKKLIEYFSENSISKRPFMISDESA